MVRLNTIGGSYKEITYSCKQANDLFNHAHVTRICHFVITLYQCTSMVKNANFLSFASALSLASALLA